MSKTTTRGISTRPRQHVITWMLSLLISMSHTARAKDLGVQGAVFPIEETSLLEVIQKRLLDWQKTGALHQKLNALKKGIEDNLRHLPHIKHVTPATQARVRFFNPSVKVTRFLTDERGNVLAMPGDVVNPFDSVTLSSPLVFINADRQEEWQWLENDKQGLKDTALIILIGGDAINAMERLGRRVYYDNHGLLSERLSLTHTPTVVTQEGYELRLEEVKI